jgi:Skp family chaperone for outer membrane proteins
MAKFSSHHLGWITSGALTLVLCVVLSSGFQEKSQKIGTVNIARVFNESEYTKRQDSALKSFGTQRQGVLDFVENYRVLSTAELIKYRDLTLKATPTEADRTEIERIRRVATAADARYRELQTKANATEAERAQLAEMSRNVQENNGLLQRLQQEFGREVNERQERLRSETIDKVKASISEVANKQGYSIVFDEQVAPYSANDVTSEALKTMNAKNK